jgi:hypothetical protein
LMAHDVPLDALRMNMMISYQELVRTFHSYLMARSLSINRKLWAFRTNN